MATPSYTEYEAAARRLNPSAAPQLIMQRYMARYGQAAPVTTDEEPGVIGSALRGVAAGTIGMGESVGTGLRYLGSRIDSPRMQELGASIEQSMEETGRPYAPPSSLQGSIADKPELLLDPRWYAYYTGQVVPTLVASMLPGGLAMRGASALGAGARAAGLIGAGVGGASGGALEGAQTYRQALAQGKSEPEAARMAEQMTVASGILNALSTGKLLQPTSGWGQRLLKGATEAATEYAEEPAEAVILGEPVGPRLRAGLNVIPPALISGGALAGAGAPSPQAQPTPKALVPSPTPAAGDIVPREPRQMAMRFDEFALTPQEQPSAPITRAMLEQEEAALPRTLPDDDPLLTETITIKTPEREALRNQIVTKYIANAAPVEGRSPIAYVMGGGGAAGKSTLLETLRRSGVIPAQDAVMIDADLVKHDLPEFQAIIAKRDGRAAHVVHEESSTLTKEIMQQAMAQRSDLIYDATMADAAKGVAKIKTLKKAGYDVRLYGVTTDSEIAIERAMQRGNAKGRFVRPAVIRQAHQDFAKAFEQYVPLVDQAVLYESDSTKKTWLPIAYGRNHKLQVMDANLYNVFRKRGGSDGTKASKQAPVAPAATEVAAPGAPVRVPAPVQVDKGSRGGSGQAPAQAAQPGGVGGRGLTPPPTVPPTAPSPAPKPPKGGFRVTAAAVEERATADAARANAEDFAQSINLSKWATTEDVKAGVRALAEKYAPLYVGARRGVQPIAEIEAAAEALAANPKELVKRIPGANMAAELRALQRISIALAEQYRTAADKADSTGADADLAAALEAEARLALFSTTYAGGATEAGRALRILREQAKAAKGLQQALEQLGGIGDVRTRLRMARSLLRPGQLASFARESWATKAKHALIELWMNMLLSGPQTHAVNISSNALFNVIGDVERYIAAGIGKLHGGEKVTFREASAYTFASVQGFKEGMRALRQVLTTGEPTDIAGRLDVQRTEAITAEAFGLAPEGQAGRAVTRAGKVIRVPSRLLGAMDDAFKTMEVRKELNALAARDAYNNKLTGDAAAQHIQAFIANPPGWALDQAYAAGQYMTFTKHAGPIASALIRASNDQPLLKLVVPFVRTPTNIVKAAVERSPFGLLMQEVRDNLRQKGPMRDIALARMAFGTALGSWVMAQVVQGLMTGGGPPDKEARNAWYATGWQPYSFKIGDKYYAFNRLEPIGMVMGIASDFAEVGQHATEREKNGIAAMLVGSVMKNLLSKTWLRGISELVSALEDPDRYGKQWLLNYAGTMVPTGVAQAARAQDPYLREARTLIDKIKSRLPWKSQELLPKRDLFGRPIALEGGVGPDIVSPIYQSSLRHDPAADELVRLEIYPQMPRRKLGGVELPGPLYDEYTQLTGQPLHAALTRIVTLPAYTRLNRYQQRDVIESTVSQIKRAATQVFLARHPDIRRQQFMLLVEEAQR